MIPYRKQDVTRRNDDQSISCGLDPSNFHRSDETMRIPSQSYDKYISHGAPQNIRRHRRRSMNMDSGVDAGAADAMRAQMVDEMINAQIAELRVMKQRRKKVPTCTKLGGSHVHKPSSQQTEYSGSILSNQSIDNTSNSANSRSKIEDLKFKSNGRQSKSSGHNQGWQSRNSTVATNHDDVMTEK